MAYWTTSTTADGKINYILVHDNGCTTTVDEFPLGFTVIRDEDGNTSANLTTTCDESDFE